MNREHAMVLFADMYQVDKVSEVLTQNLVQDQITNNVFDDILKCFVQPGDIGKSILIKLIEGKPLVFMISYMLSHQLTTEYRYLNKITTNRCYDTMKEYGKEHIMEMNRDDLLTMMQKDHHGDAEFTMDIKDNKLSVPLACTTDDMVEYTRSIQDFIVYLKQEYVHYRMENWLIDSIDQMDRMSRILNENVPVFFERSEEYYKDLEQYDNEFRDIEYNKKPYEDRVNSKLLRIISNAVQDKDKLRSELTINRICKLLDEYECKDPREERLIIKLQKNNDAIENVLNSNIAQHRVRSLKKGRWTKYVIYPSISQIKLQTIDDYDQLSMFPCIKKVNETHQTPHNVMVALFSILLWFYSVDDCSYIIEHKIKFPNFNKRMTINQLQSLINETGKPKYLPGPNGFQPYCIGYENCSRCWTGKLKFPDDYYERKNQQKLVM